jgi:hypothetical protein
MNNAYDRVILDTVIGFVRKQIEYISDAQVRLQLLPSEAMATYFDAQLIVLREIVRLYEAMRGHAYGKSDKDETDAAVAAGEFVQNPEEVGS